MSSNRGGGGGKGGGGNYTDGNNNNNKRSLLPRGPKGAERSPSKTNNANRWSVTVSRGNSLDDAAGGGGGGKEQEAAMIVSRFTGRTNYKEYEAMDRVFYCHKIENEMREHHRIVLEELKRQHRLYKEQMIANRAQLLAELRAFREVITRLIRNIPKLAQVAKRNSTTTATTTTTTATT